MVSVLIKSCFFLMFTLNLQLVNLQQDNTIAMICQSCGDAVNDYCCRYYNSCCEFLNPNGCPTPSSPEARQSCRKLAATCRSNADCPSSKHCCDTFICGAVCMNKPNMFDGYRY